MAVVERSVLRIDRPEVQQGMTPQHRVRPLMPAAMRGDFAATDPFLALMEDWFPRGVFGKHPHRGIETVTYVVEGASITTTIRVMRARLGPATCNG